MAINQYRAFCLLALGRMAEAERAIEAVLTVDLLYRPVDADMSPRLRAAFAGVRQRILPAIVQQEYARAKAAFDHQDYPAAIAQFDRVLRALGSPDLGAVGENPPLTDLRTLANGFRDLSVKAMAPPPPPPQPVLPPAPVAVVPPKGIYGGFETGIMPPVIVKQTLPAFPRDVISRNNDGVLEVVISEAGAVESAVMRTPINPRYDQIVVSAAKLWKYAPATLNGVPVKFRKTINITLKPPA
jgi:hypothetical protein